MSEENHTEEESSTSLMNRTAHVMDLDNLTQGQILDSSEMHYLAQSYIETSSYSVGDISAIACSHHTFSPNVFNWPISGQRLVKSGKDGADFILTENVDGLLRAQGLSRVVLASGDHYFVPTVAYIQSRGIPVHVVAPVGGLSKRLRMAADSYSYIPTINYKVAA